MNRLKTALLREYQENEKKIDIYTPKNTEEIHLHFKGEKMAKVFIFFQPNLKSIIKQISGYWNSGII